MEETIEIHGRNWFTPKFEYFNKVLYYKINNTHKRSFKNKKNWLISNFSNNRKKLGTISMWF